MSAAPRRRAVEGARLALGLADLVVPGRLPVGPRGARTFPGPVLRVLGVRQAVQAAATLRGGAPAQAVGGLVDALHAMSMVAVAAASQRYRRAAVAQVAIAGTLAVLELGALPTATSPERRS